MERAIIADRRDQFLEEHGQAFQILDGRPSPFADLDARLELGTIRQVQVITLRSSGGRLSEERHKATVQPTGGFAVRQLRRMTQKRVKGSRTSFKLHLKRPAGLHVFGEAREKGWSTVTTS